MSVTTDTGSLLECHTCPATIGGKETAEEQGWSFCPETGVCWCECCHAEWRRGRTGTVGRPEQIINQGVSL